MKHFFGVIIVWAVVFLCSGCAGGGADDPEEDLFGQAGLGRKDAVQAWQYVDTAMGTIIQQTVYAEEETAQHFFAETMAILKELEEEELSWRLETSEVARINAAAGSKEGYGLSEDMASLLEACLELYVRSAGAFDVTLGPLTRLWNIDKWAADGEATGFHLPSTEELEQALRLCGSDRIRLVWEEGGVGDSADGLRNAGNEPGGGMCAGPGAAEEGGSSGGGHIGSELESVGEMTDAGILSETGELRIFMPAGMQLDLGAVGKGLAQSRLCRLLEMEAQSMEKVQSMEETQSMEKAQTMEEAQSIEEALSKEGTHSRQEGITGAVISFGGSILTFGSKPDGSNWKVGIIDPFDTSSNVGILSLEGQWCVSTSGDYERYVEVDGTRYHHILDPNTGYPAVTDVRGVTILAKDGLLSDGLSTACFLLGPERGMALAAEYGAEVLFVMADGELIMSDGMEKYFTIK